MVDTLIEDFDEEECINFALSLQDKAYNQALQSGLSSEEAQKIGQNKYNEVCKRYCLEFIKKIEEKLASLKIALDMFMELGVINYENGKYLLPTESKKVELTESIIYKSLL